MRLKVEIEPVQNQDAYWVRFSDSRSPGLTFRAIQVIGPELVALKQELCKNG